MTTEAVNHPSHYGGDTVYEHVKVAEAWGLDSDAHLYNATKYICRAGKKILGQRGEAQALLEDLEKAQWYLNRRVENLRRLAKG